MIMMMMIIGSNHGRYSMNAVNEPANRGESEAGL
jgi:hypothetical protein